MKEMKLLRIYYIIALFVVSPFFLKAQQDPMFSQYYNNPLSINPAYAGSRATVNLVALHRRQWLGIDGAPVTSSLSFNKPTESAKVGYGFSLLSENIGPISQNGIYADYAYHIKLSENTKLSFGLKGGFNHYRFNLNSLAANDPDDPRVINGDKTMFLPNLGFGTFLYSERYVFGFSIPKLLQNSLSEDNNSLEHLSKEERHYFFTGAGLFNLTEGIRLLPSFICRVVMNAPVSLDLNTQFIFADKFWIGAVYRFNNSIGANIQFQVNNQIRLGYSYDLSTSWLRAYNSGTHEIALNFDFNLSEHKLAGIRFF